MDIDNILDNAGDETGELIITGEIQGFLKEAGKWSRFIAIVGFVFMGLFALIMLFGGAAMFSSGLGDLGGLGGGAAMGSFLIAYYIFILAIMIFPLLYMYRFGTNMKKAVESNNQLAMRDGLENLKSLFKFYGIFMAIILGIYAIIIVGGLLFTIAASF